MELTLREVSRLFGVDEPSVRRWVRSEGLPAHRVRERYRFNRVEVLEWAQAGGRRVGRELYASPRPLRLGDALERGGIYPEVQGRTREEVLEAVSLLPGVPDGVDRRLLQRLLVARERVGSTGVGEGIAFPHARDPLVVPIEEPRILLCFLAEPVDFSAPDARAIRLLFVLLSPTVRAHLALLSQLMHALHDSELRRLLSLPARARALLGRVRALERNPASFE